MAQQSHTSIKASPAIDAGKWHKPENSPVKERSEQSITVDSKSSSIVLQYIGTVREEKDKETERDRKRGVVKMLHGIIQQSDRNTTLKRVNQKKQRVWKNVT